MPNFRKGGAAILSNPPRANAGASDGTPRPQFLQWAQEEKKFIQFITPLEEIPRVKMHQFIITGQREDGSFIYNDFVSRRDAGIDGPDGYDPIWTRFDMQPRDRCVAAAAALEPIRNAEGKITGWDIATKTTKKGESVPEIGLIIQHPANFFSWLATYESDTGNAIQDRVFTVTRRGEGINTRYDFIATDQSPVDPGALAEYGVPDIDEYLTYLSDENRMRSLIDPLPDDAKISRFGQTPAKSAPAATSQESAPWANDEAPSNTRFAALRAKIEEVNE
jgi:hypothetical protein